MKTWSFAEQPSRFRRRLWLIGGAMLLALAAPGLRMIELAAVRGGQLRADAERRLVTERWTPTVRGRIVDRKGRVLAEDRPSFDVAVDYRIITGEWAQRKAAEAARADRQRWAALDAVQRAELIESELPIWRARLESTWNELAAQTGVPRQDLDRRRADIHARVERMADASSRRHAQQRLERGRDLLDRDDATWEIAEQQMPHVVVRGVDDRVAFELIRRSAAGDGAEAGGARVLSGVHVLDAGQRMYPWREAELSVDRSTLPAPIRSDEPVTISVRGVATHIVGWMRDRPYKEDVERRPRERLNPDGSPALDDERRPVIDRGFYMATDPVGHLGIESSQEDRLRGLRGLESRRRDTGELTALAPQGGGDVSLTLDIALQARIQAAFAPELGLTRVQPWQHNSTVPDGATLAGAAVVLDIDTGDILAVVTSPSFTPEDLAAGEDSPLNDPVGRATANRAVGAAYPPGSIVKPLMLAAAVTEGLYDPAERLPCTGHFLPNQPGILRCWIYRPTEGRSLTHNDQLGRDLDGSDAVMASCNIFFYEMGRRLGGRRIVEWYRRLGVGAGTITPDLGVDQQFEGAAPDPDAATVSEAILMGMGQGPVSWTPLHAADAYATLARGGVRIVPRLRMDEPMRVEDLGLDPRGVRQALDGLRRSAGEFVGTTNHLTFEANEATGEAAHREPIFNAPGVTIYAKSGTAQAPPIMGKDDLDGDLKRDVLRGGDHAWCVLIAESGAGGVQARYAIAVLVEYGGSGGRVAGPIANQIVHSLIAEGYLPGAGDQ